MGNLRETAHWEPNVYQIETSDPVMGGENGISNRASRQLANRTLWLKNKIAEEVAAIGSAYAAKAVMINAGNGLTGGGSLAESRILTLGTPSKISATSQNSVGSNTHSHEIDKASTKVTGIVKLNNTLNASSQDEALTAAMGKKLQDEKLGNNGDQSISGGLSISRPLVVDNPASWHALEAVSGDGKWVLETSPQGSADRRFQFKFLKDGDSALYVRFPAINSNQAVAYQSWVNAQLSALDARNFSQRGELGSRNLNDLHGSEHYGIWYQTGNANATPERNYPTRKAGALLLLPSAYRGQQIYLPFDETVIYKRTTGGANENYAYREWETVGEVVNALDSNSTSAALSAAQGRALKQAVDGKVGKAGNENIAGEKTFSAVARFSDGLRVSQPGKDAWGVFGAGSSDVYIGNSVSSKALQLKDDGTLSYSNDKIMLYSDRSDAVNLDDTRKLATAKAVKKAYDKAAEALPKTALPAELKRQVSRRDYNRETAFPCDTAKRFRTEGHVTVYPDGRIVQFFVLRQVRLFLFDSDTAKHSDATLDRVLTLPLWTAMPNKITDVRPVTVAVSDSITELYANYANEASEWLTAWHYNRQGTHKGQVVLSAERISGGADEYIDLLITVEGY